jgi:integrase/recombinase XerD
LSRTSLSARTKKLYLTTVRLFYEELVTLGLRKTNPVPTGKYVPGQPEFGKRGPISEKDKDPFLPTWQQWLSILAVVKEQPIRTRLQFAFSYDGALRSEELCCLEINDIDPPWRQITVRAEISKSQKTRVVYYTEGTAELFRQYVSGNRRLNRVQKRVFLSESRRNNGDPISTSSWSKSIRKIAEESGVITLTPHTLRHLRLTDLARVGWDIKEIGEFAGHSSIRSSVLYIHLSGKDITNKLLSTAADLYLLRERSLAEALNG